MESCAIEHGFLMISTGGKLSSTLLLHKEDKMTIVAQSNSYRGYSKTLLDKWLSYFEGKGPEDMFFLEQNAYQCLKDFQKFAPDFENRAKTVASKVRQKVQTDDVSYQKWLEEKISKALDVYWLPLSQALTQYT